MALQDAGERLLDEFPDMNVAVLTEFEIARKLGKGIMETAEDSHAGEIETSRILHAAPHLVKGVGTEEYPDFPEGILVRDKQKYWSGGVWGDPTKASAKKGEVLELKVVEWIVEVVKKMNGNLF